MKNRLVRQANALKHWLAKACSAFKLLLWQSACQSQSDPSKCDFIEHTLVLVLRAPLRTRSQSPTKDEHAWDLARHLPMSRACVADLGKRKLRLASSDSKSGGNSAPLFGAHALVLPVWEGWRASVEKIFCVRRRPPRFLRSLLSVGIPVCPAFLGVGPGAVPF